MAAQMLKLMLARSVDGADPEQALQRVHCLTVVLVSAIVLHLSTVEHAEVVFPSFSAVAGRQTIPIPAQCQ